MGSFCDYAENKVLELIVGKTAFTTPTCYVALSTTTPTDDGGNVTEPVGNGYARKSTAGTDWATASGGAISNSSAITFATASGSWGTVTHFVLYDALTAGNPLGWAVLGTPKLISNGDIAQFAIGELDITLD